MSRRPWSIVSCLTVLIGCFAAAAPAHALVIAGTDFTGRTVVGPTADNLTWVTNGVADPGPLTAFGPLALFDTADAQGHFAPDQNVGNEGPWFTVVQLLPTQPGVTITDLEFEWQHFTNAGAFQGPARSVDWTATLVGSASGTIDEVSALNVNGTSGTQTINFTAPITLDTAEAYTLLINAAGSNTTGNNTGFNALAINGDIAGFDPVPILSSDFDGNTVSGAIASNITWVTDGVADPGDLTFSHPLFNTAASQDRIGVDRNLHNEGPWTVDIPLNVQGQGIELTAVSLDAFIYNNAGALQTAQRDLDLTVALLDDGMNELDSETLLNIYADAGAIVQPQTVLFDLSGNALLADTTYCPVRA